MQQYVKTYTAPNYTTKRIKQEGDVWVLTQYPNDDDGNDDDTNTTVFFVPYDEHNKLNKSLNKIDFTFKIAAYLQMALAARGRLAAQLQSFKVKFRAFRGGIKGKKIQDFFKIHEH